MDSTQLTDRTLEWISTFLQAITMRDRSPTGLVPASEEGGRMKSNANIERSPRADQPREELRRAETRRLLLEMIKRNEAQRRAKLK